jgi:GT2 family glycosyltransferase
MVLVVPVSLFDRKDIPLVEKAFEIFPPGSGHKLLVVGSPNVETEVKELSQKLCIHFAGNAQTFIFETDSNYGWPTACNYYAQQVAFYISDTFPPDTLWLWYELDCTPLKAGWLDEIEAFCLRER